MEYQKTEEEYVTTDGGYTALKIGNLLIREYWGSKRLEKDGETFLEYKLRQRLFKKFKKGYSKGNVIKEVSK